MKTGRVIPVHLVIGVLCAALHAQAPIGSLPPGGDAVVSGWMMPAAEI